MMNMTQFQNIIVILILLQVNLVYTRPSRPTWKDLRRLETKLKYFKRGLEGKLDDLEAGLERKVETLEERVLHLELEVVDLKDELEHERDREPFRNESGVDTRSSDWDTASTKTIENDNKEQDRKVGQLTKKIELLEAENGKLKTRVDSIDQALNKVKTAKKDNADITKTLEEVIINATKTNEDLKDIKVDTANLKRNAISRASNNDVVAAALRKAFGDEKMELRSFKKRLETQLEDELEAVNGSRESEVPGDDMEAVFAKMSQQIKFELNTSREECQELNTAVGMVKKNVAMLEGKMNSTVGRLEELKAFHQDKTGTTSSRQTTTVIPPTEAPSGDLPNPVTLTPGGPWIYPVYGEDLKKHIKIGSRVVRGRDWAWRDQDGGGPGTVDGWMGNKRAQVYVRWDQGKTKRANYRVGDYNKYDLYMYADRERTTTPVPATDDPVTMTPGGPLVYPITGEALRKRIKIGSRVVRGRDWAWGNQDGGGPGTVDGWYNNERSEVYVRWDRGTIKRANYRIGHVNKYDLYLLVEQG